MAQVQILTPVSKNGSSFTTSYMFFNSRMRNITATGTDAKVVYNAGGKEDIWVLDATAATVKSSASNYDANTRITLTLLSRNYRTTTDDEIFNVDDMVYAFATSDSKVIIMIDEGNTELSIIKADVASLVALKTLIDAATAITSSAVYLQDATTPAYFLEVISDSDGTALTANRTLTFDTNNQDLMFTVGSAADCSVTLSGSIYIDMTGTGNAITFTGDANAINITGGANAINIVGDNLLCNIGTDVVLTIGDNSVVTFGNASIFTVSPAVTCVLDQNLETTADVDFNSVTITPATDVAALTVTGTNIATANVIDLDATALTTGSLIDYLAITTKTSGYLFNGSMTTSTLDASFLADDFSVESAHDGVGADTLRMIRRTWSGAMPNGTANSNWACFENVFTSTVGSAGAEGGYLKGLHIDWTGATLQGSDIDAYGVYVNAAGITATGGTGTAYNEFGLAQFRDDRNTVTICKGEQQAIETDGEIDTRGRFDFIEDFKMQTINETDFGVVLHNNGGGSDPAIAANRIGGEIDCVTGGTTADGSEVQLSLPVRADSGELVYECRIKISDITDVKVFVGLTDNVAAFEHPFDIDGADAVTATATDACGFVFDTTAATDEWFMCAVDSALVDTGSAALGVAPVNATYQEFRIEVSADGTTIKYYINNTLYGTLSTAGVTETVSLYPTVVISELNNSARTAVVDYVYTGHLR